jgi:6-pyruvoyltetrahydropterin/6-carboxytetrahydropterin synthase
MYTVTVEERFVAQHFLTVSDPGPEGDLHSHHYTAKVQLAGSQLNEWGYLMDIDALEERLDETVGRYRDATLNDLPEFEDVNPSLEQFARLFGERFRGDLDAGVESNDFDGLDAPNVESVTVKLQEDEIAWASYQPETPRPRDQHEETASQSEETASPHEEAFRQPEE